MSVGSQPPQTKRVAGGNEVVVITHEDVDRAHDRVRVSAARAQRGFFSGARLLWLLVGPGVLVMLGRTTGPACFPTRLRAQSLASDSSFLLSLSRFAWPLLCKR